MSRRLQIGTVSFLLTFLWTAGLFVAFVGGRLGQHPSPAMAVAAAGALCAVCSGVLLTVACFPGLLELLRLVAQVAAIGAVLDAAAVGWSELPWNDRVPDVLNDLEFSNFLLLPSMIALTASSVLFFSRWFSNQASRTRFEPMGAVQSAFLILRRHHRLLGWLALAFAAAHSVYFLLFPGATFVQWTGIAATALLAIGGVLGLITSYNTFWRLWIHRVIAILMVAALALHWYPFLPAATLFLIGLCAAGLAHLKLVSSLVRLSQA
ncbi:MAG: hypothetical protein JO020_29035 [Chloroflexi bacterium]|nr:hypothetical protein [Chloroflexota bacterium]MBV9898221.1 hypothetical protein [Chloroflexota bacterium]